MPELLVLSNPRRRRRSASGKTRRVRANPRRARRVKSHASGIVRRVKSHIRRRTRRVSRVAANPIVRRVNRRRGVRRNPIGSSMRGLLGSGTMRMVKDAAVGGAGAIAVELIMDKVQDHLPVSMQAVAGEVGIFDALRAFVTVAAGRLLNRPTRGLSEKMAMGALTVQAYQVLQTLMVKYAPSMAQSADNGNSAPVTVNTGVAGVGYATAAAVRRGTARVSPVLRLNGAGMGAYVNARSPLLSGTGAYVNSHTPLLSAARRSSARRVYGAG